MSFRLALSLAAFGLAAALTVPALADVPPPDSSQCLDQAEGAACVTDAKQNGTCQKDTCSKLDYSQGTPPKTVTYDCLLCKPSSGSTSTGGSSGSAGSGGSSAGSTGSGGCSFVAGHAGTAGALLALLGVPLLLRRRRSPRS